MSKYGLKDTFDLMFKDGGEVVLLIDTAREATLISEDGKNKLIIKDALVDTKLISDVFSGMFKHRKLSVVGATSVRDISTYQDKRVRMDIKEVELSRYELPTGFEPSIVTLVFEFYTYCGIEPNLTFKVVE